MSHTLIIIEKSLLLNLIKINLDAIQYHAGSIFRRKWEMSQLISKPEVKVRVDQSINMSIPDAKLDAMDELNRLYFQIGQKSYDILEYVCGFGYNLKQMNHKFKFPRSYGSHRFKECLDETAIFYGLKDMGNTIRGNKKR